MRVARCPPFYFRSNHGRRLYKYVCTFFNKYQVSSCAQPHHNANILCLRLQFVSAHSWKRKQASKRYTPLSTFPWPPDKLDVIQVVSAEEGSISVTGGKHNLTCKYDTVFGEESTQEDVFEFVKPSIIQVIQGYNCTVFAYGQTGTGKTYTMLGKERQDKGREVKLDESDECGVIPRAVGALFDEIRANAEHGTAAELHVAYMQIYNDNIYDLLSDPRYGTTTLTTLTHDVCIPYPILLYIYNT